MHTDTEAFLFAMIVLALCIADYVFLDAIRCISNNDTDSDNDDNPEGDEDLFNDRPV